MNNSTSFTISSISELPKAAERLVDAINASGASIIAFRGEMGAGKTTLISQMAALLGADVDETNSPSFSIVNEYTAADGSPIYHFDLYRLNSPEEGLDIGIEDYFDSGNLCLIEWPDRIGALLPPDAAEVKIEVLHDETPFGAEPPRRVTFSATPNVER